MVSQHIESDVSASPSKRPVRSSLDSFEREANAIEAAAAAHLGSMRSLNMSLVQKLRGLEVEIARLKIVEQRLARVEQGVRDVLDEVCTPDVSEDARNALDKVRTGFEQVLAGDRTHA